jgi:hypothetical protein
VLGGTQSLHTNSLDETYALPTEEAVTIALRTQQIIAHESGWIASSTRSAGSYYVEHLTDEMEKRAFELHPPHRRHGRHHSRRRRGLPAEGDRRVGLPVPARGRAKAIG